MRFRLQRTLMAWRHAKLHEQIEARSALSLWSFENPLLYGRTLRDRENVYSRMGQIERAILDIKQALGFENV